jgi:acyl-CoA synthetase (AMP-forming)/AMP-acid ligase II
LQARSDARAWSANGFFWSGNFAMAIGGALSSGGSLILQPTFQPAEALALMERERATMAFAWPHQYAQLEAAPNWDSVDLSSLHYVNVALARHPTVDTNWQEPWWAYGNTETFTISAIFDSGTPEERIGGSHGAPLPGNVFKIVDPLSGVVVPLGERGEIAVKGATMMLGYIGVPLDETLDAEGFFRTGDGGFLDDAGRLHWEGRLSDIIKTGGANVSPIEIDTVLKECPGVKITQTVGIPHETLGELVVTCIVPHAGVMLDEPGVQAFARQTLASFKVPRRVLFFDEGELELTGSAKIKTADLKALVETRLA